MPPLRTVVAFGHVDNKLRRIVEHDPPPRLIPFSRFPFASLSMLPVPAPQHLRAVPLFVAPSEVHSVTFCNRFQLFFGNLGLVLR
jgi:hypothetical protein